MFKTIFSEIDTDSLEQLKIMCQQLSLTDDDYTELLSKNKLIDIFALLTKYTNNDVRQLHPIMAEFVPKIIGDLESNQRVSLSI